MNPETALSRNIRLAVNRTGRARLLDNEVGVDTAKGVRYGLGVGSADLVGVLKSGRLFCLEVKTPKGRTTSEQLAWLQSVHRWGGFACVVRSITDAIAALERAEQGLHE
jgi:hypothetical protein